MLGPFDLNLRHLRALSSIAEQRSLSAAAAAVNLSQPALTYGLRALEDRLGAVLFDRGPKGVVATEAGLALAERAQRALAHLVPATQNRNCEQNITATQLKAYWRLCEAGSFSGAAASGGLSQPALHRAVRELEAICGASFVERRGRGIVLTSRGARMARAVRLAANELSAGIAEATGRAKDSGRIVVGAMPLCRARLLPNAIAALSRELPRVTIEVVEGSWRELVEPLRDGAIDLMVGALRDDPPGDLAQSALLTDNLVVACGKRHKLAGRKASLDQLAACDWIVNGPGSPLRQRWEAMFEGRNLPAGPIECGSVMVIRGLLAQTDLLTLLSADQIALELSSGVLATIGAPVPNGARTIGVTTRANWRPTPTQSRMLAELSNAADAIRIPENA